MKRDKEKIPRIKRTGEGKSLANTQQTVKLSEIGEIEVIGIHNETREN